MPCDASKCLVYVPWRRQLSSDSVGLFALSFCLLESLYVAPLPIVMRMHVWLYKSGCITYNLSAHQIVLLFGSMVSIKFICVPNDCINLISFLLSSSSGSFALIYTNAATFCMSCVDMYICMGTIELRLSGEMIVLGSL